MNVSRALIHLKHFGQQFAQTLQETRFSGVVKQDKELVTGKDEAVFRREAVAKLQGLNDSIEDAFQKRVAINKLNSTAVVNVLGRDLTISDLLVYRQHIIPLKQNLLASLRKQEKESIKTYNEALTKWEQDYKDLQDKSGVEHLKPVLYSSAEKIEKLNKEIQFFEQEVDSLLTEINPTLTFG